MSHRKIVAKVRDFLITELQESLIRKYAEQELQGIRDTTARARKGSQRMRSTNTSSSITRI